MFFLRGIASGGWHCLSKYSTRVPMSRMEVPLLASANPSLHPSVMLVGACTRWFQEPTLIILLLLFLNLFVRIRPENDGTYYKLFYAEVGRCFVRKTNCQMFFRHFVRVLAGPWVTFCQVGFVLCILSGEHFVRTALICLRQIVRICMYICWPEFWVCSPGPDE